jgi:hypothetical protein
MEEAATKWISEAHANGIYVSAATFSMTFTLSVLGFISSHDVIITNRDILLIEIVFSLTISSILLQYQLAFSNISIAMSIRRVKLKSITPCET